MQLSLLSNQWELKLSKGNNEFEVVNAVLPLFDEKDQDLKPFITSKIYSILMTFNVMQNADTCFENSYLALLSNTLMYLMTQNDSEWRNELIDKVFKTIQITYSKSKGFQKYCEQLLTNPRIAVVTEHPDLENKCEDLSKALLMFFYLVRDGKITEESQKVEILNAIFADIYGRFYPSDQIINLFFSLNNKDILKTIDFTPYIQQVKAKFPNLIKYYTPFELKGEITKEVMALDLKLNIDFEVEINLDKLWFVKEGKFSIDAQKKIYSFFLPGKEVDPRMQWVWIYHASLFRNSYERNKTDMVTDYKAVYDKIKQLKQTEILQDNPIFELVWKDLFEQYKMIMIDLHQQQYILPMNQNVLQQICTQKALKIENYKFNSVSNLLKNACMSTKCPFYMYATPPPPAPSAPPFFQAAARYIDSEPRKSINLTFHNEFAACSLTGCRTDSWPSTLKDMLPESRLSIRRSSCSPTTTPSSSTRKSSRERRLFGTTRTSARPISSLNTPKRPSSSKRRSSSRPSKSCKSSTR